MPTVHDGIGTWYYGKRRIHTRKGTCEFCGGFNDLVSYDTTLFFVVFMVPLIPLSRKRILEQCSQCKQHRVVPLKQWEEAKVTQGADVLEKLRADPNNRDGILDALSFAQAYQDEPLFDQLIAPLAKDRVNDAEIQMRLADGYSYFGHWTEAEAAYRASLTIQDDESVRERLAWVLLKQERPEEARPLLQHILDKKLSQSAGTIYFLILGYQAAGLHDEALALMDERDEAFPDLVNIKEYNQQRKLSQKHRGTQKPVHSALLAERQPGYRSGNWTAQLPRWIGAAVLLGLIALYFGSAFWIGQSRKVFLVNGTNVVYDVAINGQVHSLRPGATPVRIAEGDVEVSFPDPKKGLDPWKCQVETSFWGRPFTSPTLVINPDQVAVLVEEETWYAKEAPPPGQPPQFHTGQGFYTFSGINYEFEPFPRTITVKGSQSVRKTRVDVDRSLTPEMRYGDMMRLVPPEQQADYCKRLLRLDPHNALFLGGLSTQIPAEQMLAFLESRLDERPLLVDWHRAYQSITEKERPKTDLTPRYQKLAAESGDEPDAVYLLGRILPDLDKGDELIRKAATAKAPSAHALMALGYRALCDGKYTESVDWFEKALPLAKDKLQIRNYYEDALWAKGDYDRLLQQASALGVAPGSKENSALQRMRVHAIRGEKEQARAAMAEALHGLPPQVQPGVQRVFEGMLHCYENDVAGFLKASTADGAAPTFEVDFLQGKLQSAAARAGQAGLNADVYHSLLYLAATRQGAKELADAQWQALLGDLAKGGKEERRLAELLTGKTPLTKQSADRIMIEPRKKRVFLAVLAQRQPEQAQQLLDLARRLDFQRDAISLCLRQVIEPKNGGTKKAP